MSLRIMHVSEPTEGGAAVVLLDMAADQLERGWSVSVAAPEHGFLLARAGALGAGVHPWSAARRPGAGLGGEVARLGRAVRTVAPDVVHLHSSKAGLAGRLAVRGRVPTVFQPHGWAFRGSTGLGWAARVAWERLGARWSVVLCVSDAERTLGVDAGIRADYVVIPTGVDTDRFAFADDAAREQARAQLGLPDVPTAVCVGRLSMEKGQHLLLDAWPGVRAAVPDASLVLVGDGPDRGALAARSVPGVVFAGEVDDTVPWYASADVVVLASRVEAMPLTILEALSCGRSVVTTAVDGAREALDGARAGAVVPIGDAEALGHAVAARLGDPSRAAAEGRKGRQRAEEWYPRTRWAERVAALVTGLVGTSERQS